MTFLCNKECFSKCSEASHLFSPQRLRLKELNYVTPTKRDTDTTEILHERDL